MLELFMRIVTAWTIVLLVFIKHYGLNIDRAILWLKHQHAITLVIHVKEFLLYHIHLEYSDNVSNPKPLLLALNQALVGELMSVLRMISKATVPFASMIMSLVWEMFHKPMCMPKFLYWLDVVWSYNSKLLKWSCTPLNSTFLRKARSVYRFVWKYWKCRKLLTLKLFKEGRVLIQKLCEFGNRRHAWWY